MVTDLTNIKDTQLTILHTKATISNVSKLHLLFGLVKLHYIIKIK